MKISAQLSRRLTVAWVVAVFAALLVFRAGAEEIRLAWKSSGVTKKVGYYIPLEMKLSGVKPAGVKKAPDGLEAPVYGEIKLAAGSPASFGVILDEPEGKTPRLFIDANGKGDFSDDPPVVWTGKESRTENGFFTTYSGGADLSVSYGSENVALHFEFSRFDKRDPDRAAFKDSLFYYRDFGRAGDISLGGKSYKTILADDDCSGDFRGSQEHPTRLFIDINGDGKFQMNSESFVIGKPFTIGGVTYDLSDISASGDSFKINKSSEKVPEALPELAVNRGRKAPVFKARTTGGSDVDFPEDYKGKVVLLDFWATWCPPCLAEMPNVVAAYNKYHDKGFDVLAVSLDRENETGKLAKFTKANHMAWPQIYDGKYWHSEVAQAYAIDSIPHAFLIDGDTGIILADGPDVRGEALVAQIEKAFARRSEQ